MSENKNFSEAIESLDFAYQMAQKIKNENVRHAILSELKDCQEFLIKSEYPDNFDFLQDRITFLFENSGEILADCGNANLIIEICNFIKKAIENIEASRKN